MAVVLPGRYFCGSDLRHQKLSLLLGAVIITAKWFQISCFEPEFAEDGCFIDDQHGVTPF